MAVPAQLELSGPRRQLWIIKSMAQVRDILAALDARFAAAEADALKAGAAQL